MVLLVICTLDPCVSLPAHCYLLFVRVMVSGQCLDGWSICVGFHGLVAGLDLVCGDPWGVVCQRGFEAGQI